MYNAILQNMYKDVYVQLFIYIYIYTRFLVALISQHQLQLSASKVPILHFQPQHITSKVLTWQHQLQHSIIKVSQKCQLYNISYNIVSSKHLKCANFTT